MGRPPNTSYRRQQVSVAVLRLLAEQGAEGVTMSAVARSSGLAQGLLHYHFADKAEMMLAALAELERRLLARVERAVAGAADDAARLAGWVDALVGLDDADPEAMAAWVAVGSAVAQDEALAAGYVGALTRLRGHLAAALPDPSLADAACALVEGAWRLGAAAPGFAAPGFAAEGLRRLLGVARPCEAREGVVLRALRGMAPAPMPEAAWTALRTAFSTPGRHYHTLEHVLDVALAWDAVRRGEGWADEVATWLAVLFHDAVYVPGAPDNESRSAMLVEWLVPGSERAGALIRLTAAHGAIDGRALDADARRFLDCDVAILGAPAARYRRYMAEVAAEWAPVVSPEGWRAGRLAFVERLMGQKRIFLSDGARDRLEASARLNLADEAARL
jgi:predicted metal-dependent HD superfamily phosphohydrolase/DNA-binding transcriptional regulator YbjK